MKKLIFLLLLLPIGLMAQKSIKNDTDVIAWVSDGTTVPYEQAVKLKLVTRPLPPASASITITINDSSSATLADIRDTLCTAWGYTGNPNDNAAKLAFLKQILINKIVGDYNAQKTSTLVQNIQVSVN